MVSHRTTAVVTTCLSALVAIQPAASPRVSAFVTLLTDRLVAAPASAEESSAPTFAFRDGELARVIAAYKTLPAKVDRSAFDVAALAAKIGGDPLAAFAFVRDHIAHEIYPGVLRGPAGTLQAGAGNDLDRSLLLAGLLSGTSHRVRFARCTLRVELAERRVAAMFGPSAVGERDDDIGGAFQDALTEVGLAGARSIEIVAARQQARQWLTSAIGGTAREDVEVVRAALSRARLAPSVTAADPRILEDAKDHYWVQVARGETWQDLDTSVPGAPASGTLCAPGETFDSIPPAAYQTVTLSLRNEYIEGQRLRQDTVLSHRFRVSDVYGQVISLVNVGVPASDTLLQTAKLERFIPFARTSNAVHIGTEFTAVAAAASAMSTALDAFSGGEDPPLLAAQWVDFVLEAPGRRTTGSRALVDLISPAERRSRVILTRPDPQIVALALAQSAAVAVSCGEIHEGAAIETAYRDLDPGAVGRAFDTALEPHPTDEAADDVEGFDSEDVLLAGVALSYAAHAERALVDLDAAQRPQVRLIRDQPMLTIANLALRRRTNSEDLVIELAVDLRHDQARVAPRSSSEATAAFWANVLRGLLDGALEHHLPALAIQAARGASGAGVTQIDTSGLLKRARAQGIEVRAYSRRDTPNLHQLIEEAGGSGAVRELADDSVVIMPASSVEVGGEPRLAMWSVDPATGDVLSLLDTGMRGQATTEGKLVRLINFLETQIRRCVASGGNMNRCRRMFRLWADAANDLRHLRNLPGRITMNNGNFVGFTF